MIDKRLRDVDYREVGGPFIGTRATQEDEFGPKSFSEYWMDTWGVNIGATTNDYDGDGLANLAEYALGGSPINSFDQGAIPLFAVSGNNVDYIHSMRNDDSGLEYMVETTTNLTSGPWVPANPSSIATNGMDSEFDEVMNSIPITETNSFYRLRISTP